MSVQPPALVLVTGGAGFIGSHLVEALLETGYRVRVADNLVTGRRENLARVAGRVECLDADLADPAQAAEAVRGTNAVLHQAAIPSVPRSVREPLESHASGPTATLNLLEAARRAGVKRFVFAASSSAYGDTDVLPKHEDMPALPLSPYAAGKVAGELYVRVYAQTMGLDGVSLRYFNIFGPRQDPSSPYSGVISLFLRAALEGQRPIIYGDGRQTRDFTYVSNAVQANLRALRSGGRLGGQVLNVGTGRRVSLLDLVSKLGELCGVALDPEFRAARAGDVRDSQASLERIRSVLGYEPDVDFETGLRTTLQWTMATHAGGGA